MTKREYAEAIAEMINGKVVETEKANGVIFTGVSPVDNGTVTPIIYIDRAYESGITVKEAAANVQNQIEENKPKINIDFIKNYDEVKPKLRVALYNKKTVAPLSKSAMEYGFPDLILVPYIDAIQMIAGQRGTIKVNDLLLEQWGKTSDEVIADGIENLSYNVQTIGNVLGGLMGTAEDSTSFKMYVVSNNEKTLGASSIIKAHDTLKEIFPEGYYVIPSSIHEVLVVSREDTESYEMLTQLIQEVNATQVADEEVLGSMPYAF